MPKKKSIFSPSAKIKICTFSKTKWKLYNLSWDHFNSSLYIYMLNTHLTSKTTIWLHWLWKIQHTLTQTNQNWAQFQKAQLTPYKTRYAFSSSPPGQGVMSTNLLHVIPPRMEPIYKPKSQLSTVALPDNCKSRWSLHVWSLKCQHFWS